MLLQTHHIYSTLKERWFPRHFNVEYIWCVCVRDKTTSKIL